MIAATALVVDWGPCPRLLTLSFSAPSEIASSMGRAVIQMSVVHFQPDIK